MRTIDVRTQGQVALCGTALLLVGATALDARPKLGGDFIDRGSIQVNIWCPAEYDNYFFDGSFVADGEEALLVFTLVNYQGGVWYNQSIDNVVVAERSVYDAYSSPVDPDDFLCILQTDQDLFHFNTPDELGLLEALYTFDSGVPPEWDLSDDGYYDTARSAPNDIDDPNASTSSGSLGLGTQGNVAPLVTTSVLVTGLTAGTEYVVSLWCVNKDTGVSTPNDITLDVYGEERWARITDPSVTSTGNTIAAGWVDIDSDTDLDLYLSNAGTQSNPLIRQDPGHIFTDLPSSVLTDPTLAPGAAWGDADNDGDLDVFVPGDVASLGRLFRNEGAGVFVDTGMLGSAASGEVRRAIFGDVNADGYLDLFLGCEARDVLLVSVGIFDGVPHFDDVSAPPLNDLLETHAAALVDIDLDGDLDIATSHGLNGTRVYRNDGGTFVHGITPSASPFGPSYAMAWGDHDTDGDYDLFLETGEVTGDRLFRNDGCFAFVDISASSGFSHTAFVDSPSFVDADNDGDLDLFMVASTSTERLYRNDGSVFDTFVPIEDTSYDVLVSQDGVWGDFDADGDLDVYIANYDAEVGTNVLVRNDGFAASRSWLHLDLVGTLSNRTGIGSRIEVSVSGEPTQVRQVGGELNGRRGHDSFTEELGLGAASLADVVVTWPSGVRQLLQNVATDQRLTITEPDLALLDAPGSGECPEGGKDDGVWEPGEQLSLTLPLSSIGTRTHTGATGLLTSMTPGVTVLDGFVTWPGVPPGEPTPAHAPGARVLVGSSVPCGAHAELLLQVATDQGGPYLTMITESIGATSTATGPWPIPNESSPTPITSDLVVAHDVTLTDLDVFVNIQHELVGDLRVVLEAPDGTKVKLLDRPGVTNGIGLGCFDDDVLVTFDDEAAIELEDWCDGQQPWSPPTGRPLEPLAALDGSGTRGTWRLHVSDHFGKPTSEGSLIEWTLLPTPPLPPDACTPCTTTVGTEPAAPAPRLALAQNRPNPVDRGTAIAFSVPARGEVRLDVYDVAGRLVRTLRDEVLAPGEHVAAWDARGPGGRRVAAGVYYYVLTRGSDRLARRLQVLR